MKVLGNFTGRAAAREAREILAGELGAVRDPTLDAYHYTRDRKWRSLEIEEVRPNTWQIWLVTEEEREAEKEEQRRKA